MRGSIYLLTAASLAVLASCGDEAGSGGVTPEESRQLDEAAAMLDEDANQSVPAGEEWLAPEAAEAEAAGSE